MATIGVLALQGDFQAHARVLTGLGAEPRMVRAPADLQGIDGLVIPGGESTTMTLGIDREGLAGPLRDFVTQGHPTLGTCAGLIMLDREHLDVLDVVAERNAFGRQVKSFESDIDLDWLGERFRAVFIRAPWVAEHGEGVRVLAEVDGHPVAVQQGNILAVAFHSEIEGDPRLHEWLLAQVEPEAQDGRQGPK
ncbi:MAG: pyridoxal 5'-phosphate synthase glutaminase subunit PdxT [Thermoleophilaceae bacterium]